MTTMTIPRMASVVFLLILANSAMGDSESPTTPSIKLTKQAQTRTFGHMNRALWKKSTDPTDCRKYTLELLPKTDTVTLLCDSRQVWDRDNLKCDLASNVPRCLANGTWDDTKDANLAVGKSTSNVGLPSVTKESSNLATHTEHGGRGLGRELDPRDCRKYIEREFPFGGIGEIAKPCGDGLVWNRDHFKCDLAANVPKCLSNGTWLYSPNDPVLHYESEDIDEDGLILMN